MKKFFWLIFFLPIVGACGAYKPLPDWINASHRKMESYKNGYLAGRDKYAAEQFKGLLTEVKKSGDPHILGIVYLNRMALQTACLEKPAETEFLKIAGLQTDRGNETFYAFLKGQLQKVAGNLLPPQYREINLSLQGNGQKEYAQVLEKIKDPLSRLIATGVIVRLGKETEAVLQGAAATASEQGWKKAVLVYLERLKSFYEAKHDTRQALAIGERIKLIRD